MKWKLPLTVAKQPKQYKPIFNQRRELKILKYKIIYTVIYVKSCINKINGSNSAYYRFVLASIEMFVLFLPVDNNSKLAYAKNF